MKILKWLTNKKKYSMQLAPVLSFGNSCCVQYEILSCSSSLASTTLNFLLQTQHSAWHVFNPPLTSMRLSKVGQFVIWKDTPKIGITLHIQCFLETFWKPSTPIHLKHVQGTIRFRFKYVYSIWLHKIKHGLMQAFLILTLVSFPLLNFTVVGMEILSRHEATVIRTTTGERKKHFQL